MGYAAKKDDDKTGFKIDNALGRRVIIILMAIVLVAILSMTSTKVIDEGERGIVLRLGRISHTLEPGVNMIIPFVDKVVIFEVRTQKFVPSSMQVYSVDIQPADILITVNYSINPAMVDVLYEKYGKDYLYRVLAPSILARTKDEFGRYNASAIIQQRIKLQNDILTNLTDTFAGTPIVVESLQIENIEFDVQFEESIMARMKAEVKVAEVKQELEKEKIQADVARTRAQALADSRLLEAKAEAEAIRLMGDAEAMAIKARAQALAANNSLVELTKAEKWNGELPTTMVPGQAVPFINIK